MIYAIVAYGDPVLRQKTAEVEFNAELEKLVEDMFETMYNAKGVGLAAPQIGKALRLFVIDPEAMDEENLKGQKKVFINPTILNQEGEPWPYEEGCLSIPDIHADVNRMPKLTIKYQNLKGDWLTEEYDGLIARVIQHEYDHIEGILFIDHLTSFKKQLFKAKLQQIVKGNVEHKYRMRFAGKK